MEEGAIGCCRTSGDLGEMSPFQGALSSDKTGCHEKRINWRVVLLQGSLEVR
jgi:hypothetical protein